MNKANSIEKMINVLIDNIETDSDVEALTKLLIEFANINISKSQKVSLKLINSKFVMMQRYNIDFTYFFKNYFLHLLNYIDFMSFLTFLQEIKEDNRLVVDAYFFNIYSKNCPFFVYLKKLLNDLDELLNVAKYLKRFEISRLYFDYDDFLYKIVIMCIENGLIDIDFFNKLNSLANSKKSQIIIKSLYIDYIP